MAIKAGEVGKILHLNCSITLTAATSMTIDIIDSNDAAVVTVATGRITAPATPYVNPTTGETYEASTYMKFLTQATDFPTAGVYTLLPIYNDTVIPEIFYGDAATITIEARDNA